MLYKRRDAEEGEAGSEPVGEERRRHPGLRSVPNESQHGVNAHGATEKTHIDPLSPVVLDLDRTRHAPHRPLLRLLRHAAQVWTSHRPSRECVYPRPCRRGARAGERARLGRARREGRRRVRPARCRRRWRARTGGSADHAAGARDRRRSTDGPAHRRAGRRGVVDDARLGAADRAHRRPEHLVLLEALLLVQERVARVVEEGREDVGVRVERVTGERGLQVGRDALQPSAERLPVALRLRTYRASDQSLQVHETAWQG